MGSCAAVSVSSQVKRVIVVQPFTLAAGVELPYDMKLLQPQLVADARVQIGKEFDVVAEPPANPQGSVYTLDGEITGGVPATPLNALSLAWALVERPATCIFVSLTKPARRSPMHRTRSVPIFTRRVLAPLGRSRIPIAQKMAQRIEEAKPK